MTAVTMLGFPGEIVGIVAGFYRLFDMASTTGNCLGDLVGTVCVSKMEEQFEMNHTSRA
ncbi:MAG: cation:dicarboxylase symporter family transporter, partial [Lachnospiraceae bacterium]|nr:cation:dicarboxylase symporter family transporter [Lachnospiraceae bacterium]